MLTFRYRARDKSGKMIEGNIQSESIELASEKLLASGLILLSLSLTEKRKSLKSFLKIQPQKVKSSELVLFTRQLYTLLNAGVSLTSSLESLAQQTEGTYLERVIKSLIEDIRSGKSFSGALEKFSRVFNNLYCNLIKSGEATGKLDEVLNRLAMMGEYEEEMRARIRSALMYPVIVVCALIGTFILMVTFVLPRFAKMFSRFKTTLPLPTRILLGINYLVSHYGIFILGGMIILIFALIKFNQTPRGKEILDRLKLKLPIFGPLFLKIGLSRFCRTTAGLISSGIPIVKTLELVEQVTGNTIVSQAIKNIKTGITTGESMQAMMRQEKIFPPLVVQMVAIGEETGKTDELLNKVSDYFDYQINHTVKNLTTLIEPILISVLGAGVLFMSLAIFLPMWNLIYLFKK
ncbi:MAG: type II secretion system F family protein [Candidatus Omnitrophica bacterium]|nr:type II secretion system F family protein [Candidatus Omnitrophota bacterium]MCM8793565.1 type II secretion system F family protein [Candidatus Omnitrophota bacterium]